MKIAVSAGGKDLESLIDPLFGRCPYFIIVDTDDSSFEALDNPNISLSEEAGIKSAQLVASKGVKIVITGKCGPRAVQILSELGIEIIVGLMGTVRQVVERYKTGDLLSTDKANVEEYFGKRGIDTKIKTEDQSHGDSGLHPKNRPWYGYVRLQQETSGESKGDKE